MRRWVAVGAVIAVTLAALTLLRGDDASTQPTRTGGVDTASDPSPRTPSVDAAAAVPTADGAREAGLSAVAASQRWLYLNDEQIASEVRQIATPAAGPRLARETVDELSLARRSLQASPGRVWWLVTPLAWRVDTMAGAEARVSVWAMSLLSAADVAVPQAEWFTVTVDLEWSEGAWLVAAIKDQPGPSPTLGPRDRPWEPEPFDEALAGFHRLELVR